MTVLLHEKYGMNSTDALERPNSASEQMMQEIQCDEKGSSKQGHTDLYRGRGLRAITKLKTFTIEILLNSLRAEKTVKYNLEEKYISLMQVGI